MRWDPSHSSPDLIDRRGQRGVGGMGGLLYLLPLLLRSPIGWVILLLAGGYWLCTNVGTQGLQGSKAGTGQANDTQSHFVGFVLDDTQKTWEGIFAQRNETYRHAKLVLYTDSTRTGCGFGDAATGPFYCPNDERVYIDLGFFAELDGKLGAHGDFAKAYVVAHEIGHHVQKQLGIEAKASGFGGPSKGAAGSSVRLELQADCFAGIWAHSTGQRDLLESGDIDSALSAAAAVGDDRLQRASTGTVSPESWTHGSSEERTRWFQRGYDKGSIEECDTFSAKSL